ncbi:hypothetical protein LRM48_001300 [Candidatus Nanosynbacter sp. TM7-008]|jgi:hypothetical protein|uniref:hypothetical protein n=1 Tax=Candidatus Nanosynbacter sp. TM7-008 TaxID=2902632 RepID=UPI001FB67A37|nr:hypothetical protein [Candidatus Nanosynbacter sp. TM7-008]MCJ1964354.1 hypothetical protein [Candidatus Nanosynbacter sp. TM7-008]DAW03086.1 MAG TPA: hypothetical protein [Inoviridae sp.]
MPENMTFFDAATAGSVFKTAWGVISSNFAGIAVLLGAMIGLAIAGRAINSAVRGKVKVK